MVKKQETSKQRRERKKKEREEKKKKEESKKPDKKIIIEEDEDAEERAGIENLIDETEISTFQRLRIPSKSLILEQDEIISETPQINLEEELQDVPTTNQQDEDLDYTSKSDLYSSGKQSDLYSSEKKSDLYSESKTQEQEYQTAPQMRAITSLNQPINPITSSNLQEINTTKWKQSYDQSQKVKEYIPQASLKKIEHKTRHPFKKKRSLGL